MKIAKTLWALVAAVALASSANAVPTITISDGIVTQTATLPGGGLVVYANANFDASWSVVITTGLTKPALGTAGSPQMDIGIQATSLAAVGVNNLVITFSETDFGPTSSALQANFSGHVVSGTGQNVTYNTYFRADNALQPPVGVLLTSSGIMPGGGVGTLYTSSVTSGALNQTLYSLGQQITITSGGGATYSLDASLIPVPDGGTTVMLLGSVLAAFGVARRYWKS